MIKRYKSSDERDFKKPVAWLFGHELLRKLKWIMLYAAAGSRFDPRQWMQANVYQYLKEKNQDEEIGDEFWFDYFADTGDGMMAVYSIAYLCLSDLYVEDLSTDRPVDQESVREVRLQQDRGESFNHVLPRGRFLFVGGDTGYHIADYETLANRFQTPFEWAYQDLTEDLKDLPNDLDVRRPLLGIPGNHDYYDEIDGFRRQFRRHVSDEDLRCRLCGEVGSLIETKKGIEYECKTCSPPAILRRPQLQISGFKRCQEASYLALELPFGWWLWGLDTERGGLDYRQKDYFLTALKKSGGNKNRSHVPDKLIVANSIPIFVLGQLAKEGDVKTTRAFDELDLALPYHHGTDDPVEAGQCRLDLSGDTHHYARYGGPHNTAAAPREGGCAPQYANSSYASVVCGLGGAFNHPSLTYADEIKEQVLYPSEKSARRAIAERIFKFWTIWQGGYIGAIGAIITTIFYYALAVDLPLSGGERMPIFARAFAPKLLPHLQLGSIFALSLLALSLAGLYFALKKVTSFLDAASIFKASGRVVKDGEEELSVEELKRREETTIILLCLIVIIASLAWFVGLYRLELYTNGISPFFSSIVIFLCSLWAVAAIWLNIKYKDMVANMSSVRNVTTYHLLPMWMLWISVFATLSWGIFLFGGERFWLLAADLVCLDTFIGINVAIIYLATNISNEIGKSGKKRGWPFWLLIGLLHLIFQLAVPLLIVSKGTWQTWLIAVLLVFLVSPRTGEYLLKNNICWCGVPNRWWLLIAWITFGAMMLGLAFIGGTPLVDNIADYVTPAGRMFVGEERVKDVIGLISACMAGGVTSCIWLGWYLAVSLGFNGHNNEVGGAVRLENFKGFVRIRLTEETLSGFVIAVDEPQKQGGLLRPRIIDAFTLVMKPGE